MRNWELPRPWLVGRYCSYSTSYPSRPPQLLSNNRNKTLRMSTWLKTAVSLRTFYSQIKSEMRPFSRKRAANMVLYLVVRSRGKPLMDSILPVQFPPTAPTDKTVKSPIPWKERTKPAIVFSNGERNPHRAIKSAKREKGAPHVDYVKDIHPCSKAGE